MANHISRRSFLRGATASGLLLAGPVFWEQPAAAGTPGPSQVHLQYGADASRQMSVSWATDTTVRHPRLQLGTPHGGFGRVIEAQTRGYTDGQNGVATVTQHARLDGLHPDSDYLYEVVHDGATPIRGAFRTAPVGRVPFRFTSFGDLGSGNPIWSKSSINAITAIHQVERFNPTVHLLNGDLSYANVNQANQPAVWTDFMNNMMVSARNRPWMPALGNHEVEAGNGALGYNSYLARFDLPDNHSGYRGNWYSFQVGSVLFISLDNNDVVYANDGGQDPNTLQALYIRGYSHGAQTAWLRRTLAAARTDRSVDWIVAYMHQPAISSSSSGSGGDLGIRQQFMELFYEYGVDLVLAGHDHDYERSYLVRGTDSALLRPKVVDTRTQNMDTSRGLVHLVLGGGGTSSHDDVYGAPDPAAGGVPIAQVYTQPGVFKAPADATEDASWSAVRDPDTTHPWGMAVFDVDPGHGPGAQTSISVTYYHTPAATAANPFPDPIVFDSFTVVRLRRDDVGFGSRTPALASVRTR
jgi:calcineurin-like phosphoesterase family protein/purple acid phosphatase-like protein